MADASGARRALGDMARSLGLVAALVAGLLLLGPARTLIFPGDDRLAPVDYDRAVVAFDRVASVHALVPAQLPDGWRANAADVNTVAAAHLHIGWATPGERFAGLDEAVGDGDALLRQVLGRRGLAAASTVQIGTDTWTVRESQRRERAYTRSVDGLTIVVTGDATDAQLRALAGSLS